MMGKVKVKKFETLEAGQRKWKRAKVTGHVQKSAINVATFENLVYRDPH